MPRRFVQLFALPAVVLMSASCDMATAVDARDLTRLARAETRWKARPFADYTYEIRVSCFCPPEIGQWTRVTVGDGAVTAVEAVDPNAQYPPTTLTYWRSIDSIFEELFRTMSTSSAETYLDAIIVSYDDELGYPTSIEYRAKANVADGGAYYSLRNVVPLP